MANCLTYQIDEVMINGVSRNIEQGSAVFTNPVGWENEMVPAAKGDHGVKRKRVPSTIKFKEIADDDFDPEAYSGLASVQIVFRDTVRNRRGRVSKCTFLKCNEIGNGDSPEIEFGCSSKVQWI